MLRKLAIGSMLVAGLGCASTAAQRPAPAAKSPALASAGKSTKASGGVESMLICEMERPTGSNIPERVCRRATDTEMQRLRTQDMLRVPQNQTRQP